MSMTHESETRTPGVPSLSLLIRQGRADAEKHGQRTRDALAYWFRQTERLNIARSHYRSRGERFVDFARRIGVDRSSAFELVKLHKHKAAVLSRCLDEAEQAALRGEVYHYPGWQTALAWFEGRPEPDQAQYWLVPPEVYHR